MSTELIVGIEFLITSTTLLTINTYVLFNSFEQAKAYYFYRMTHILIFFYAISSLSFSLSLIREYKSNLSNETTAINFQSFLVGFQSFIILYLIWRAFYFQYWRAAKNLENYMNEIKQSLEEVKIESDELDSCINRRRKYCILTNFLAIATFFLMSDLISVSYLNLISFTKQLTLTLYIIMFFLSFLIFSIGLYYFFSATAIFTSAAKAFNMQWDNKVYQRLLLIFGIEISFTIFWGIILLTSYYQILKARELQIWAFGIAELGRTLIMILILNNQFLTKD